MFYGKARYVSKELKVLLKKEGFDFGSRQRPIDLDLANAWVREKYHFHVMPVAKLYGIWETYIVVLGRPNKDGQLEAVSLDEDGQEKEFSSYEAALEYGLYEVVNEMYKARQKVNNMTEKERKELKIFLSNRGHKI